MDIAGAVALVTGASAGIGRAVGLALAREGATVAGVARRAGALGEAVEEFRSHAAGSVAIVADVSSREECERAVASVIQRFGRVDILVNNAGISIRKPAAETTVEDVERVLGINFLGAVFMTGAALPGMIERRRGSIVNITSVAGYLPNPQESAYGASKAALSMWSHGLAVDLHATGVHVGVVSPGPIDTEIWDKDENPAAYAGKRYAASVVADAVLRSIRRRRVHVTVPHRFGIPAVLYPLFGRPMRWGLRRYDSRGRARSGSAARTA